MAPHAFFGSEVFDRVIAAEVLEHIGDDQRALDEIARVLRPAAAGGDACPPGCGADLLAAVGRLSQRPGGHVRIYTRPELEAKLRRRADGGRPHHPRAGLHSPYWWLQDARSGWATTITAGAHLPPAAGVGHHEAPAATRWPNGRR